MTKLKQGLREIVRSIDNSEIEFDYIVGISRGGLVPAVYLSHMLEKPLLTLDFSTRDDMLVSNDYRKDLRIMAEDILKNKCKILIVEDIVDSGKTMNYIKSMLNTMTDGKFTSLHDHIKTCALLWNPKNEYREKVDFYHMIHDPVFFIKFDWEAS